MKRSMLDRGRTTGASLFAFVTIIVVLWTALRPRFGQDPSYHHFADARPLLGVPNAFDVLSNLAFAAVGIAALLFLGRRPDAFVDRRERLPWIVLFVGVALTSVGSAWYHLAPDNARLVWRTWARDSSHGAALLRRSDVRGLAHVKQRVVQ